MSHEFENETSPMPERWKIVRGGILYAIILAVTYQAGGYLGTLVGWHRRSTLRECVLAAIIGFLVGSLLALKRSGKMASPQASTGKVSTPEDSRTW